MKQPTREYEVTLRIVERPLTGGEFCWLYNVRSLARTIGMHLTCTWIKPVPGSIRVRRIEVPHAQD